MCGIVGYVGYRSAQDVILEGLHRLEYRGYDSAGVAIARDGRIGIRKKAGRVQAVAAVLDADPLPGTVGIGHTRWATHGATTDVNSHPHVGGNGEVVLVHNGVIENHSVLRSQLQELGYVFRTGTDTEVIAHLIAHHLDEQLRLEGGPVDQQKCLAAIEHSLASAQGDVWPGHPVSRLAEHCSSGPGWAARWSSASGMTNSFWPAIRVRWSATPTKSCIWPTTRSWS